MTSPIRSPQFAKLVRLLLEGHEVTWGTETHAYRINPDSHALEERSLRTASVLWYESGDSFNNLLEIDKVNSNANPPRIYNPAPETRPEPRISVPHVRRVEL